MNIYIGNLSYDITEDNLLEVFAAFGHVESVNIIKDRITGESKGFGFVEMPEKAEAQDAIRGVTQINGRQITINEARPRTNSGSYGNNGKKPRGDDSGGTRRY